MSVAYPAYHSGLTAHQDSGMVTVMKSWWDVYSYYRGGSPAGGGMDS